MTYDLIRYRADLRRGWHKAGPRISKGLTSPLRVAFSKKNYGEELGNWLKMLVYLFSLTVWFLFCSARLVLRR